MKITEVRRKFGTAIAILTAIGLTFASCTADSGDDAPNPHKKIFPGCCFRCNSRGVFINCVILAVQTCLAALVISLSCKFIAA